MERIILDTDIGDDIDDALALNLLLSKEGSDKIKIEGITTVAYDVDAKAKLVKKLLKTADRTDIPVFAGESRFIASEPRRDMMNLNYTFPDQDDEEYNKNTHAVDFIIDTVLENENEISLLPIGPLTNIGLAMKKCPEIIKKIKRIVCMGGMFYEHCVEWNIYCDPEAAKIVFESGCPLTSIGIDVTQKCYLSREQMNTINSSKSPLTLAIAGLIDQWQKVHPCSTPCLHDPLAACFMIRPEFIDMEEIPCLIELNGALTRGMTVNTNKVLYDNEKMNRITVGREVRSEEFIDYFLNAIIAG